MPCVASSPYIHAPRWHSAFRNAKDYNQPQTREKTHEVSSPPRSRCCSTRRRRHKDRRRDHHPRYGDGKAIRRRSRAIGPGTRNDDGSFNTLDVKQGDRVLFGKWGGTEVKIDGKDLLIMKESDIMGVIG